METTGTETGGKARRWRWAGALAAVAAGISGISQAVEVFQLPACDAEETVQTVMDIFASKDVPLKRITEATLVAEGEGERSCAARIEAEGETGRVTYRVYWEGWSKGVQIGEVTVDPAPAPAG